MSGTAGSGLFAAAPWVLLAYLILAVLAPWLCNRFGRAALVGLAALPALTTAWAAAMLPAVLDGGNLLISGRAGWRRSTSRSTCAWTRSR